MEQNAATSLLPDVKGGPITPMSGGGKKKRSLRRPLRRQKGGTTTGDVLDAVKEAAATEAAKLAAGEFERRASGVSSSSASASGVSSSASASGVSSSSVSPYKLEKISEYLSTGYNNLPNTTITVSFPN